MGSGRSVPNETTSKLIRSSCPGCNLRKHRRTMEQSRRTFGFNFPSHNFTKLSGYNSARNNFPQKKKPIKCFLASINHNRRSTRSAHDVRQWTSHLWRSFSVSNFRFFHFSSSLTILTISTSKLRGYATCVPLIINFLQIQYD